MSDLQTLIDNLREWGDEYKGQPVSLTLMRAETELADMRTLLGVRDRELAAMTTHRNQLGDLLAKREEELAAEREKVAAMETRHAAVMLHTQTIVEEANTIKQQRNRLAEALQEIAYDDPEPDTYERGYCAAFRARQTARKALAAVEGGSNE